MGTLKTSINTNSVDFKNNKKVMLSNLEEIKIVVFLSLSHFPDL